MIARSLADIPVVIPVVYLESKVFYQAFVTGKEYSIFSKKKLTMFF